MRQVMQKVIFKKLVIMGLILVGMGVWTYSGAQEDEYILAYQDIFGNLRRPQVSFSHEVHAEDRVSRLEKRDVYREICLAA